MKNKYLDFDEDKKKLYKNTKIYKAIVVLCMCSILCASLYFGVFNYAFKKAVDIIPEEVSSDIPIQYVDKHKVVDTVVYKNLTPGKTYTVTGVLYDKKTGDSIATTSQQFVADESGQVILEYDLDKEKAAGKTLVAVENLGN